MEEQIKELIDLIREYLDEKEFEVLSTLFDHLHPADIAEILEELEFEEIRLIFRLFQGEKAAEVLAAMETERQLELLKVLEHHRILDIFDFMSLDETVDLLGELSEEEAHHILNLLEAEDKRDLQELLDYPQDTAGGIMTTEYVAIQKNITIEQAITELRRTAPDAETIYYVYVVDHFNHLVGVISLRELIVGNPQSLIKDIMHKNIIHVGIKDDQEEVARIVAKYDLLAVPVIDQRHKLAGIITVDDVIDVIEAENTEDIYKMMGATETIEDRGFVMSLIASVRSRLPWLLITVFGGVLSGSVVRIFSDTLNSAVAIAYFMPLLAGMGGNVGTQSATIMVRGIATGEVEMDEVWKNILQQGLIGSAVGVICGLLVTILAVVWQGAPQLGLIVGIAMWVNMSTASIIGTLVPFVFKRVGVDPAIASAPFISTTIDITGLTIYFSLVTLLLQYI